MINILEVNNIDIIGRAFNGYDLIYDLSNKKFNIKQAVINKLSNDKNVIRIFSNDNLMYSWLQLSNIEEKLSIHNMLSLSTPALMHMEEYKKSDIIHFHMFHNSKLSLPSLLKISREKKVIISLHDPWFLTGRCVHFYDCNKWQNGCKKCDHLDTLFQFEKDNCNNMWNIKKEILNNSNIEYIVNSKWMYNLAMKSSFIKDKSCIHFIPFGIDLDKYKEQTVKERYNIPSDNIVLFLRAQNEFKGTKYVVDALKELQTDKKITLLTCDTKGLLDEIKNKYNVVDLGVVSQDKIIDAFNLCDVFLMPSIGETFGMMGVEAMACSKPVIGFDNTAIPSTLFAPECGYIVKNKDSHELMLAIKELVENEEERINRGQLGRKLCEENYSYQEYLQKLQELYENIYEKKYSSNLDPYGEINDIDYLEFQNKIYDFISGDSNELIDVNVNNMLYFEKINNKLYQKYSNTKLRTFNAKISVIIPVYNGDNFLNQAIDSVLKQTYDNYEIIVVDDGSTDNTSKIAKKYKDKIKYYYKPNGGVASALNYGISKMSGDYFAWLSHDDMYRPEKLETQVDILSELTDKTTILFSNFELVDSNKKIISKTNYLANTTNEELCVSYYPVVKGIINGCTILINKKCFDKVGLFDEKLRTTQDYDMWLKLFKEFPSYCISSSLVDYRIHPKQDTNHNPITPVEGNDFWEKLVDTITISDIKKWHKDPFRVYMDLSIQMKNSNFLKASKLAYDKAKSFYGKPEVSVIIPCFNAERFIKKALDSAVSQTFTNMEIIVVDDNSTDKSYSIVEKYLSKDFRIKLYKNKYEKGVSGSLNTGLDVAKGKYFARLDADDTMAPDKIECQYNILLKKEIGFVATNINFMDKNDSLYSSKVYNEPIAPISYLLAFTNPVPNATIMYRLDLIKKYNLRFDNLKIAEDFKFLVSYVYSTKSKGCFVNYGLYNYRILENSLFHSNKELAIANASEIGKSYYKTLGGNNWELYNKLTDFNYEGNSGSRIIDSQKALTFYREYYELCSKYYTYDDEDKNLCLIFMVGKYSTLYNRVNGTNNHVNNEKRAYVPKTKIGNKIIYYYRTRGIFKTIIWLFAFPIRIVKRKLLKRQ